MYNLVYIYQPLTLLAASIAMRQVELRFIGPQPLVYVFATELIAGELGPGVEFPPRDGAKVNVGGAELTIASLSSVAEKRAFPPEVEKVVLDVVLG